MMIKNEYFWKTRVLKSNFIFKHKKKTSLIIIQYINQYKNRNKQNIEHLMKRILNVCKKMFFKKKKIKTNQIPKNQTNPPDNFKFTIIKYFLLLISVKYKIKFKSLFSIYNFLLWDKYYYFKKILLTYKRKKGKWRIKNKKIK